MVEAGDGEADVNFDDACSQASDGCGLQNILALSSP